VFDRSAPLPTGGYLEQADGTAWMALFCQNMLEIATELELALAEFRINEYTCDASDRYAATACAWP